MMIFRKFRQRINERTESFQVSNELTILESVLPDEELEEDEDVFEDDGGAPTNNAGSGNIAGIGVGPQGEPGVPGRTNKKLMNGPAVDPRLFADKIFNRRKMAEDENAFAGAKVFQVDPDTYSQCRLGKNRYHRWSKYVGDSDVGRSIREFGRANTSEPIVVMNNATGEMMYLRNAALHNWKTN